MKRVVFLVVVMAWATVSRFALGAPVPEAWVAWTDNILRLKMLDEHARELKLSPQSTQWLTKRSLQARGVAGDVLAKIQRGETDERDPKQFNVETVLAEMQKQPNLQEDHARLVQAMQSPQGQVRELYVRVELRWNTGLYGRTLTEETHRLMQDLLHRCSMLFRSLPSEAFEDPAEKPQLQKKLAAIEKTFLDRLPKPPSDNDRQLADDVTKEFKRAIDAVQ